ncbi:MAG: hypothetical protein HY303_14145 [Candidatus Wallbacteria bacterium]|nr:hypothetical protein [Candidatus Wallbacteria bacterium]
MSSSRIHLLGLAASLALAACSLSAGELPPERMLELPAFRPFIPEGTVAGSPRTTSSPVLARAEGIRSPAAGKQQLRVALVLLDPPKGAATAGSSIPKRQVRLVVARQEGRAMAQELVREREAYGVHWVKLAACRPGALPAVAIQWAENLVDHSGWMEVWALGGVRPELAWSGRVGGAYFEPASGAASRMVLYQPEPDSLVSLPRVFEWQADKLVPARGAVDAVSARLLKDYDEVLQGFAAERPEGEPPRMVVDVALSRGRVLEQLGRTADALAAYEAVSSIVPAAAPAKARPGAHEENVLRVAEAVRRAAALRAKGGGK